MTDDLEGRLRAHFAERAAATPVAPGSGDRAPTARPAFYRRPAVLAAAAAVALLATGAMVWAVEDDGTSQLTTIDDQTTTTAASPTTATTIPASPTSRPSSTPVVAVAVEGILGWWDGNGWVRSERGAAAPARRGDGYRVVRLGEQVREATGSAPKKGCELNEGMTIDVGLTYPEGLREPASVAIGGTHELQPRPVEVLDPSDPEYRDAARQVLAGLGVDDPDPNVVQVVRSDLDGDGADEVVVTAQRLSDSRLYAKNGDYSVVFLRRTEAGREQVQTSVVVASIAAPKADEAAFVGLSIVAAVADLNGDGRTEVIASGRYYEGSGTAAYELDGDGRLTEVLAVGCGA